MFNGKFFSDRSRAATGNANFGADGVDSGALTHVYKKGFGNGPFQPTYFESSREASL